MSTKIDLAVDLMVEVAKSRTIPEDYVSRLYQVEMEVTTRIGQIMEWVRAKERELGNQSRD